MFWGYVTTLPCLGHQIKVKCPHRGDFICSNRLQGDFGCLKELKTFKSLNLPQKPLKLLVTSNFGENQVCRDNFKTSDSLLKVICQKSSRAVISYYV